MVFRGLVNKFKHGLAKTRRLLFTDVTVLFRLKGRVDKDFLHELEKRLYLADVGTAATSEIVDKVRQAFSDKEIGSDVEAFVKQQLRDLLASDEAGLRYNLAGPTVVMAAGINGAGNTPSI